MDQPVAPNALHNAMWRWHFYAGLIVLPVLCWLAITGGIYLFKPELERVIYRDWLVLATPAPPMAVGAMVAQVERTGGVVVREVSRPADTDESWRMLAVRGDEKRTLFVDPATARVLGETRAGGVMAVVRDLHSLAITGPVGNALVEIAAGWAVILVVTGLFLWWPRRGQPPVTLGGAVRERRFWRNLHGSVGTLGGLVLLFLAITGLPWSVFWGEQLRGVIAASGTGRPAPPVAAAATGGHHDASHTLPWSMRDVSPTGAMSATAIGPDRALALSHIAAPWTLKLPDAPGKAYVVASAAPRGTDAHVAYIGGDGRVLLDARYDQFGIGARAVEWGISVHQGQEYGAINRYLMLAGCLSVILLAISAPVMWWKRRSGGRLRAPPTAPDARTKRRVAVAMIALGVLLPLTGATMLVAWAVEGVMRRRGFA